MELERRMEPVVKGALEQGGLPREMALGMGANTQSNVIKPPNGNWLGIMRSVADGPVGVDGGWNHQPFDGEPARCYHKSK